MATKPWSEVASSPQFQALPAPEKEAARQQYFAEVVAPQVPPEEVENVKSQFDADTKIAEPQQPSPVDGANQVRKVDQFAEKVRRKEALRRGPHDMPADENEPEGGMPLVPKKGLGIGKGLKETGKALVGALLETPLSMASSMIAKPASGIAGLATTALTGGDADAGVAVQNAVKDKLTYEPSTKMGQVAPQVLGAPTGAAIKGWGMIGEPFGLKEAAEKTVETGMDIAGVKGMAPKGTKIGSKTVTKLTQPQEAILEAQKSGFKALPAEANPRSVKSNVVQTVAQADRLSKNLNVDNLETAGKLVREDLKLGPDARIDRTVLKNLRTLAGNAYGRLKSLPDQVPNNPKYDAAIIALTDEFAAIQEHTPGLFNLNEIHRIQKSLAQSASPTGHWTADGIVDITRKLRETANRTLKSERADSTAIESAYAMRKGADALEHLLEDHLTSTGNKSYLDAFRDARTQLAKLHTVEESVNPETGRIDPQKVRREYEAGVPLSGGLEKVAKAAAAMPEVMKGYESLPKRDSLHVSDVTTGVLGMGMGAGSTHGYSGAAAGVAAGFAARAGTRKYAGSNRAQTKGVAAPKGEKVGSTPIYKMSEANPAPAALGVQTKNKIEEEEN
jgi:hypothetical protein